MTKREIREHECFLIPKHIFKQEVSLLRSMRRFGECYQLDRYPTFDAYIGTDKPHINMIVERGRLFPEQYFFITVDGDDHFFQGYYHGDAVFYQTNSCTEALDDGTVTMSY